MNRSRDLHKSVENKGSAAVKLRKKEKKVQRPVSGTVVGKARLEILLIIF